MIKLYFYKVDASYSSLGATCATVECLLLNKDINSFIALGDHQEILSYKNGRHLKTQEEGGKIR